MRKPEISIDTNSTPQRQPHNRHHHLLPDVLTFKRAAVDACQIVVHRSQCVLDFDVRRKDGRRILVQHHIELSADKRENGLDAINYLCM